MKIEIKISFPLVNSSPLIVRLVSDYSVSIEIRGYQYDYLFILNSYTGIGVLNP